MRESQRQVGRVNYKTSHNPDSQSSPRLKYLPHFLNGRSPSKHSYLQTVSCGVVLRAEPSSLAF